MTYSKSVRNSILLAVSVIVLALVLVSVRMFVLEPRQVEQRSMMPTLHDGDLILVNKLAYTLNPPDRGDVIVFGGVEENDMVKRIVGVPGDNVDIRYGKVFINGNLLDENDADMLWFEKEIFDNAAFTSSGGETLDVDQYYVVGDNRELSKDSRSFGPIEKSQIKGEVFAIVWPFGRIGAVK